MKKSLWEQMGRSVPKFSKSAEIEKKKKKKKEDEKEAVNIRGTKIYTRR